MKARGSALVSVILVLLVLTIVGVGIAYFTSMEDRLSGNTRITKAGFYAADAGLRRGEALLGEVINLDPTICGAQTPVAAPRGRAGADPHGPWRGIRRAGARPLDDLHSAAASGRTAGRYLNVVIPPPASVSVVDQVTYSLYLRNNVDDAQGTDVVDTDNIVNLVSVGTVQLAAGVLVTKIVEEQLLLTAGGGTTGGQKNVNAGGTNTVTGKGVLTTAMTKPRRPIALPVHRAEGVRLPASLRDELRRGGHPPGRDANRRVRPPSPDHRTASPREPPHPPGRQRLDALGRARRTPSSRTRIPSAGSSGASRVSTGTPARRRRPRSRRRRRRR